MNKLIIATIIGMLTIPSLNTEANASNFTSTNEIVTGEKPNRIPAFPGGQAAMRIFFLEEVKYPEMARKQNIQGTVYIGFDVDERGYIVNAHIVKGVEHDLDQEALRVVNAMPKWAPGAVAGIEKGMQLTLPVRFEIED